MGNITTKGFGIDGLKTGKRRIIRLLEVVYEMRLQRRTTQDSSRRIIRLVPFFILKKYNQKNCKCLLKFVQTDASSSIKAASVASNSHTVSL